MNFAAKRVSNLRCRAPRLNWLYKSSRWRFQIRPMNEMCCSRATSKTHSVRTTAASFNAMTHIASQEQTAIVGCVSMHGYSRSLYWRTARWAWVLYYVGLNKMTAYCGRQEQQNCRETSRLLRLVEMTWRYDFNDPLTTTRPRRLPGHWFRYYRLIQGCVGGTACAADTS